MLSQPPLSQPTAFACPGLSTAPQTRYRGRWYLFPGLFSGKLRHKDGKQRALESSLGGGCCWSWSCRAGLGACLGQALQNQGTDYFSPFPVVPAWPLHAPRVPQQTCWDAWSKAGIAIPTGHPLPGLLEGVWDVRELRAADLSRARVPPHPNPIGFCSFCFPLSLL